MNGGLVTPDSIASPPVHTGARIEILEGGCSMARKQANQWMALPEVARQLRLSVRTVRRMVASGDLPARRLSPRLVRVRAGDLEEWTKRRPLV